MKYCNKNWLTGGRLPEPATDQMLFTRTPSVQWPGCVSATADGPIPSLPCTRNVLVAVGNWKNWAYSPNQLAWLRRRQEKGRNHISEAKHARSRRGRWTGQRLPDDWRNPPDNQIPVSRNADWYDGLDIQNVLSAVTRTHSKIIVVLDRDADETRDGVLRCFLKSFRTAACGGVVVLPPLLFPVPPACVVVLFIFLSSGGRPLLRKSLSCKPKNNHT